GLRRHLPDLPGQALRGLGAGGPGRPGGGGGATDPRRDPPAGRRPAGVPRGRPGGPVARGPLPPGRPPRPDRVSGVDEQLTPDPTPATDGDGADPRRSVSEIFDPRVWEEVPGFELTDVTYHRARGLGC